MASEARPAGPVEAERPIASDDLDADAVKIVQRLTRFDHQAFLVGGCVRDLLVGLKPKDFDVGTSATPRQVRRLFRNCRIIGRRFRLAHIYFADGKIIEVATFRARSDSADGGERPEVGEGKDLLIRDDNLFGTPAEDALRRDFTVNALSYDVNRKVVVDYTGGLEDLERRRIRTIGDPSIRFREDPIRILRAIRFAARLDFHIERETLKALTAERGDIPKAAPPRILDEINKLSRGGNCAASFDLLRSARVFEVVLPEIADAYGTSSKPWELLSALLAGLDAHVRGGGEAQPGALLAALLLPALRSRFGWADDGSLDAPKRLQVRDLTDTILQPLSLRLRVPRKEQEHCRQILLSLYRIVPVSRLRKSSRQSLLRRSCLPDVLWMLGVLGGELGGELATARDSFADVKPEPGPTRRDDRRTRGGRRRRRRGGGARDTAGEERRGRQDKNKQEKQGREDRGGQTRSRSRRSPRDEPKRDRAPDPATVGDDYFFSALPTVPDMQEDDGGDRYGAADRVAGGLKPPSASAPESAEAKPEADPETEKSEESPAPRRRRKRRRSRRRKPADSGGSE